MAVYDEEFDRYYIYYMTGGSEVPTIDCYDGTALVGKLIFHSEEGALPANLVTARGVIYLRYRLSQFGDVIEILRHEKPLYLRLTTPSLIGYLATREGEPVGEEEP